MAAHDDDRYRFRAGDLERVPPSRVRIGDLIAHAGPVGSGLFCADPVTFAGWAGYDRDWRCDVYRVEYRAPWGESYFVNPDRIPVYRLTAEARTRASATLGSGA